MSQRAPSMPVTSSATGRDDNGRGEETVASAFTEKFTIIALTKSTPRISKFRHAPSTLEKWKSSNDLESIEVQGFKDLGFVFDQEELRESLVDVLPGLYSKAKTPSGCGSASDNDDATATTTNGDSSMRRP
ncbi:hypothetical protein GUJ93_ZPchr0001g29798 [Zizania palustris]|uniref:Uncharacterized protein n=1 Tax=Zizania palustris TaxID=103762 RepID=A0A8J5VSJ2_ZIZPA|nr:hypothetical protein GUJ93_ZPchr0001g29798 [Zizania palustris]